VSFEIYSLGLDEKDRWRSLVQNTPQNDIHFLPEYLSLFEEHMSAKCRLFHFGNDEVYILFPIFIRNIGKGPLKDAVSPWYYGGPLIHGEPDEATQNLFMKAFVEYLRSENIVSMFSRSNPYRNNNSLLGDRIKSYNQGEIVYIDLSRPVEDIWNRSFDNNARRNIRREQGYRGEVFEDRSNKYIKEFHRHYINDMVRKDASPFYRFSLKFIESLFESFNDHIILMNKVCEEGWVAGEIDIYYNGLAYAFLATRDHSDQHINSHYLIEWNIIQKLKNLGVRRYDIGSGPVGSGLLRHKKSLSKDSVILTSRRLIVDRLNYRDICTKSGMLESDLCEEDSEYFPEYRITE
jgi:hypothetical protein